MFKRDSQAEGDLLAMGAAAGYAKQALEWSLRCVVPHRDFEELFLDRWEDVFDLVTATTFADRVAALQGAFRLRGTTTRDLIRTIMVPAFPGANGDIQKLEVDRPDYEDLDGIDHDHAHARQQNHLHVFSFAEDLDPDLELADDLLGRLTPAVAEYTVGRYRTVLWDTDHAFWQRACWEPDP
jgi:hypothetical protein